MQNPTTFEINYLPLKPDWSDFFKLESFPLTYGWNLKGQLAPQAYFAVSKKHLCFGLKVFTPANYNKELTIGQFQEGLWNQDVAELFIVDNNQRSYQEINLAPSGAYWSNYFTDYRKPATEKYFDLRPNDFFQEVTEDSWSVGMALDLSKISVKIHPGNIRLNITAITDSPDASYYSLGKTKSVKPDFHAIVGGNSFLIRQGI